MVVVGVEKLREEEKDVVERVVEERVEAAELGRGDFCFPFSLSIFLRYLPESIIIVQYIFTIIVKLLLTRSEM